MIKSDISTIDRYFRKLNLMNGGSFEDFMDQLRHFGFRIVSELSNENTVAIKHDLLKPNQPL
jgi:hypothetical protein